MNEPIDKIFELEKTIKDQMRFGKPAIDIPPQFRPEQMGLVPVYGDEHGQLWVIVGNKLLLAMESDGKW